MSTGRNAVCAAGLAFFLLAGCGPRLASMEGEQVIQAEYTQGQIMVIAATERNRYQNVYTSQLWQVQADAEGNTFEEVLKERMSRFLVELATVDQMAEEQEVELTGQEEDAVNALSQEYYSGLSQGDLDYMEVSQEEVEELYLMYYRADKLAEEMTKDQDLEVSDAEAKVIDVLQIQLETREEAEEVLAEAQAEGADFASLGARYSVDSQISRSMEWSEDMDALGQAAFSLEQDEVSGIVEQDGAFYILKCTNAYDQEATAARKEELAREKRSQAFRAIYEPYAAEHTVVLAPDVWDAVDFSQGEGCTTDNFFSLYQSYFAE